jgi:hypothetical protein
MASGIFLFITGAVLFAERGTPIEIPVTTNSKPSIPSIILLYRNKQFEIHNTGPALSLWGTKVAYNEKVIEQQGRYIVTGAFYYLPAAHIDQQIVTALGPNGKGSLPLELYLQDPTPRRITVKFLLGVATQNGVVTINTQMLDVTDGW